MKKFVIGLTLLFSMACSAQIPLKAVVKPTTPNDFDKVTVMVTNLAGNSGGTGVIYKSTRTLSYVLTNKHVCKLMDNQEGVISGVQGTFKVVKYKLSEAHDICVLAVAKDLGVNTTISSSKVNFGDKLFTSGHPFLLPTILTEGLASKSLQIQVMEGLKPCDGTEKENDALNCIFLGGVPVLTIREALVSTNLISPGNSGSAVFNDRGEIVGLVFAGSGDISRAFIVPEEYLNHFLKNEVLTGMWLTPGTQNEKSTNKKETKYVNNTTLVGNVYVVAIQDTKLQESYPKVIKLLKGINNVPNDKTSTNIKPNK